MPHRWCKTASLRRKQIEGNLDVTFSRIMLPYFLSIVENLKPKKALEIGAGTGHLAKALSKYINDFVIIEPSVDMLRTAQEVLKEESVSIHSADVQEFSSEEQYELIYSNMCIQAIQDFEEVLTCVKKHITPNGVFSFTIPHPCFYNDYKGFFSNEEFSYIKEKHKSVEFNISLDPQNKISDVPYYHRPLSYYINKMHQYKFYIKSFDELFPSQEVQKLYGCAWKVPRYCAFQVSTLGVVKSTSGAQSGAQF